MLFNSLLFNLVWFGCVLLGNSFAVVVLIWAVWYGFIDAKTKQYLPLVCIVTVIGVSIDTLLMHLNVLVFNEASALIPPWLMMIWLAFAMTINGYLRPLQHYPYLQFALGLLIVPLSYLAGQSLSAVSFTYSTTFTFLIFSLTWGALLPLFFFINQQIQKEELHEDFS